MRKKKWKCGQSALSCSKRIRYLTHTNTHVLYSPVHSPTGMATLSMIALMPTLVSGSCECSTATQVRNEVVRECLLFTGVLLDYNAAASSAWTPTEKRGTRETVTPTLLSPRATNRSAPRFFPWSKARQGAVVDIAKSSCRGLLSPTIILCSHIVTKWKHKAPAPGSPAQCVYPLSRTAENSLHGYTAVSIHTWHYQWMGNLFSRTLTAHPRLGIPRPIDHAMWDAT